MRITSSSEYGARLMVQLARSSEGGPVAAKTLAEKENIPRDYVDQILMRLRRAGLVESRRGAAGGYALSRSPAKIQLAEIVQAVEGRVFEEVCDRYATGTQACRHQDNCGIQTVWARLAGHIEDFLAKIPLSRLVAEQEAAELASSLRC